MEIKILDTAKLNNIPSGSGIAKYRDGYYVIGDDSPYLYFLNQDFEVISKTLISDDQNFNGKRIVKSEKADFESLELINDNELIVFGSGGKSPQRDVFVRIFIDHNMTVEQYNISEFYNHLKNLEILEDSELNIEGTAFYNGDLYLFNRRKNIIIKLNYEDFLAYIKGESLIPNLEIQEYSLPKINDVEAGFSGATILNNGSHIIFTASVEKTDNGYDDGEILGSFIGMIDISNGTLGANIDYQLSPALGENLKIESVTVLHEQSSEAEIMMITDDDQGNSILLKSTIVW